MSTFSSNALRTAGLSHDWVTNHLAINVDANSGIHNAGFYTSSGAALTGQQVVMGCYLADDIPYYWALAQAFALCDHYFCSALAGTFSNRMFLVGGTITDPESPPPTSGADKGIYKGSQYNGPPGAPHPVPTQYNGTDPVLYNFNAQPGQTIIPPGQAMPGPSNVPGVAWVSTPVQWGSYLADLWHSSGDGSLYRVYDDWNWQFGGTTSPPGANGWVGDLNTFYYYQPYQAPSGQITLGTPGDPSYYAANYNVSGTPGDLRPLFAQHVAPAKPLLLTHRDPPEPYLAKLTWILPPFNYSDHPVYTSAEGSYYVAQIVDALRKSEFWESTVLIITYDESDTHFDHLPPPLSPDPRQVPDGVPFEPWVQDVSGMGDETAFGVNSILDTPAPIGAGMRVPTIIVSPWTYGRGIISDQLDHTSILQLTETVFRVTCSGLPNGLHYGWRRANFANLYDVIQPESSRLFPAQRIIGVPAAEPTVSQWRTNANNRLMMKSNLDPTPPPSAQVAPPPRRRARSSSTPTPTIGCPCSRRQPASRPHSPARSRSVLKASRRRSSSSPTRASRRRKACPRCRWQAVAPAGPGCRSRRS